MVKPRRWIAPLALCTVVAAGAALRVGGLSAKSLWLDEAMSWQMQRFAALEIVERCAIGIGTYPPLYYVLLRFWTRGFGDTEGAMRWLAALFGIAIIPAVYFMTRATLLLPRRGRRALGGGRASCAGLLASALVAISPLHIYLSQQVRGYTLSALLVALAAIALLRAIAGRDSGAAWGAWSAFVVCAAAAAYSHYLALLSIAAICVFAVAYLYGESRGPGRRAEPADSATARPTRAADRRPRALALALLALALAYSAWAPRLFRQSQSLRHSWPSHKSARNMIDTVFAAIAATPAERLRSTGLTGGFVVAGIAVVLAAQWRSKRPGGKYLALAGGLPVAALIAFSLVSSRAIFSPRYLAFAQLHWLCAVAATAAYCRDKFARPGAALALAALSAAACIDCWPELGRSSGPDMRAAAAFIREHRRPGEMVVAAGTNVFFSLSYYLRHDGPPLLTVAKRSRDGMFGLEHLSDGELVTYTELAARRPAALWVVDSDTFAAIASKNAAVPSITEWETVDEWSFAPDYDFEHPIVVSYLRPRPRENGS